MPLLACSLTTIPSHPTQFLFIVPHGTSKVQVMLQQAALGLADGGKEGTFTPMYLIVARKPGGKK